MKVKKLIRLLENYDLEANVLLMTQQSHPFEYSIAGVAERRDFDEEHWINKQDNPFGIPSNPPLSDVLLIEGAQVRRGSQCAWSVIRR